MVLTTQLPSIVEFMKKSDSDDVSMNMDNFKQDKDFSRTLRQSGQWQIVCDTLSMLLALGIATILYHIIAWLCRAFQPVPIGHEQVILFLVVGLLSQLWLSNNGHYRQRIPAWEAFGHLLTLGIVGCVVLAFAHLLAPFLFSALFLLSGWAVFVIFLVMGRRILRKILKKKGKWNIPTIIVGNSHSATALIHALHLEPQMGFSLVEQIDASEMNKLVEKGAWERLLLSCQASHLFLALEGAEFERHKEAIKALVRERLPCSIVPPLMELPIGTLSQHHFLMHDVLMLHDTNRLLLHLPCLTKRAFDIICSSLGLLVLSPLMIPVAFKIKRDGGDVFFKQNRVGKNGKLFACYKFRSMRVDAEQYLEKYLAENPLEAEEWHKFQKLKNDVRITEYGHFIRKTSIDELPQLINVLKGEMSLVGPRPIMPDQEVFYGEDFSYYTSVRPGITGPWQVSGRNKLTFSERVALECSYARNWSLWLDIVIMLKTVPALLKKDSVF